MLNGFGDIGLAHERFADEHGVDARGSQSGDVGGGANAAFRDEWDGTRDALVQADGVIEVRDERAQVAIVDADKSRIQSEDAVEIPGVVEFDEGGHAVGEDRFVQIREFRAGEAFGDEQNGIGSGRAGFDDLVLIEDEILSQHRD